MPLCKLSFYASFNNISLLFAKSFSKNFSKILIKCFFFLLLHISATFHFDINVKQIVRCIQLSSLAWAANERTGRENG